MTDKHGLEKLIEKYLNGQASPEERMHLNQWMHQLDQGRVERHSQPTGDELKRRIDHAISRRDHGRVRSIKWRRYAAAASVILVCSLGLLFFGYKGGGRGVSGTLADNPELPLPAAEEIRFVSNPHAFDTLLTLSDGTSVTLTAGSALGWRSDYGHATRSVELLGNAFFEVAKVSGVPFSVTSGVFETVALGTTFWIRQEGLGGSPVVTLVSGKVMVRKHDQQLGSNVVYLTPGQTVRLGESGELAIVKPPRPKRIVEPGTNGPMLKNTGLAFENTSLSDVFHRLAEFYGAKILFEQKDITGMSFYGTFDKDHRLEDILETIAIANGLDVTREGPDGPFRITRTN